MFVKCKNKGIFNQNSWLEADTTVSSELSIQLKCELKLSMEKLAGSVNQKMRKTIKVWGDENELNEN